jgi:hypothetical protein
MKSNKIVAFKDPLIEAQFNEILSNQFQNAKRVEVEFTAADKDTRVPIGFYIPKNELNYIVVRKTNNTAAEIYVGATDPDTEAVYLRSSAASITVTLLVWKEG